MKRLLVAVLACVILSGEATAAPTVWRKGPDGTRERVDKDKDAQTDKQGGQQEGQDGPAYPTPAQIEQAIAEHRIINGMTLLEAKKAVHVSPRFSRRDGVRVATWTVPNGNAKPIVWYAEVYEQDNTVWRVTKATAH